MSDIGLFIQHGAVPEALPAPCSGLLWPYRRVVEWWPEVVPHHAESRLLSSFVRRSGQPALEVGCGLGHRLFDCRAAGLDIDGLEPSGGLYAACRARLEQAGLSGHRLYSQPLHEIDLPRHYQSIYAGGVLGTGATPEADAVALLRLYRALEPGGTLLFDHPAPWGDRSGWRGWSTRWCQPKPWPPPLAACELGSTSTRDVLRLSSELHGRVSSVEALTYSVQARHLRDGELVGSRGFVLRQRLYTPREVMRLSSSAGFDPAHVACAYLPEARRYVWVAEKIHCGRVSALSGIGPVGLAGSLGTRW